MLRFNINEENTMKKSLYVIITLLIIGIISGCGGNDEKKSEVAAIMEIEPNNEREQAMDIADGMVMEGLIDEKLDQDWYKISVTSDTMFDLRAELTGIPDINLKMELFDAESELLLEVNRYKEGDGEFITNYTLKPGDYFIRVRELWLKSQEKKFNDSLRYSLRIDLNEVTKYIEQESNNKGVLATTLEPELEMIGYISPYKDVDWYTLKLPSEQDTYIELSLSGVEGVNTKLRVYDPIEALIKSVDQGKRGEGETITNLGVDTEREFYYVVIDGGDWQTNELQSYKLQARFIHLTHKIEFEPNDRLVKATELVASDSICGFIDSGDDVDWYRIAKNDDRTHIARIEVSGIPKTDIKMTITNELEEELLSVDERGEMEGEIFANVGLEQRQDYYLKLESKRKGSNIEDQYCIFMTLDKYFGGDELEINDSHERANIIDIERAVQGYIHPLGDVDYYRLEIADRHLGELQIILSGIMKVNTDFILYDAEMNELAKAAARREEGVERLTFEGAPGIYYIKVFDNDGKESNYRDKYQLAIFRK